MLRWRIDAYNHETLEAGDTNYVQSQSIMHKCKVTANIGGEDGLSQVSPCSL